MKKVLLLTLALVMLVCVSAASADVVIAFSQIGQESDWRTANTDDLRNAIENKAITKAVTVPQWLLKAGKEADINFSQTLQDALMEKLGIRREIKRRRYKKSVQSV